MPPWAYQLLLIGIAIPLHCAAANSQQPPAIPDQQARPATELDLDAEHLFHEFVAAYRSADYSAQWRLVDPRSRYWFKIRRWNKSMEQSRRRHGALVEVAITHMLSVNAKQLPCTEMGHCYRKGVPYALLMLKTRYEHKQVPQPEFAVLSMSEEGWRWSGGTFPATALGETAVLLDEADDKKFRIMRRGINRSSRR